MELERALRDHGHRITRPRRVVWDVLVGSDRHLSAPEIIELVHDRDPSINASSTYRVLTLLAELGLVRESRLGDDASTWEPRHADSVIHLVCDRCGVVTHHHAPIIEDLSLHLDRAAGFDVGTIDVRANGACGDCRDR